MTRYTLLIIILANCGQATIFGQTTFNGGSVFSAENWSNGLPSVGNPGTIAVNGTMNGAFDFNQNATGTVNIAITGGTISASVSNFFNGPTDLSTGWSEFQWTQTGGTITIGTTQFSPNMRQSFTLAGGSIMGTSGSAIGSYNSGRFNQTGGTTSGVELLLSGSTFAKTHSLSGGSANLVPRFLSQGLNNRVEISGSHSIIFSPTMPTSNIETLNGGTINFQTNWTGSWTRDNFTASDWQTVLTDDGMLYNNTQITVASFSSIFQVIDSGAVGSRVIIVPEPISVLGVVTAIVGIFAAQRRRQRRHESASDKS